MSDEQRLIEKLQRIEALFAGAATLGEKEAAAQARERIRSRLLEQQDSDPPVEFTFNLRDQWSRQLLIALLRRYQIRPYRYPRQRHNTVVARVPKGFLDEILWPEFQQLNTTLFQYLADVTKRVIAQGLESDSSEVEVRATPAALPPTRDVGDPG